MGVATHFLRQFTANEKLIIRRVLMNAMFGLNIKVEAEKCLGAQNACNLSGVIIGMNIARQVILDNGGREKGTDWFRLHPIMQMYASKINDLCNMGLSDSEAFSRAYRLCQRMAAGETDCY